MRTQIDQIKKIKVNSFSNKIAFMIIIGCTLVACVVSGIALTQNYAIYTQSIESHKKTLFGDFDILIKSEVETAVSMLQNIHDRQQKGELKADQAKTLGAEVLRGLRYGKDGYFWADTPEGVNIVLLGKKEVEGKSRIHLQDKKGNHFIQEIIKNGMKEGGGYSDYYFPKAGSDIPLLKRGYSLLFKPWGWVVGTGNYVDDLDAILAKESAKFRADFFKSIYMLIAFTLLCVIAAVFVTNIITRKLLKQVGGEPAVIAEIAEGISEGDLTHRFESNGKEKTGVYASMDKMTGKLTVIAREIKSASDSVAAGSQNLSASSDDLNRGAQELSSQIEQIVTAMTEISQTIMDMAKNASQAAEASRNASDTAAKGKEIVDTTAADMIKIAQTVQVAAGTIEELGRSSAQIGEIVTVINGIADQTNLLALNAAIEAARAGEQGRGFAVVADEVRKLAERTSQATKDIVQRIASIQAAAGESVDAMKKGSDEVDKGVGLAKQASASLDTIVASSTNAMDMVQRIAAATEQQSAATEEVTQNMENIATITKRAAGSSDQIKASATELEGLSLKLKEMIAWFRV